MLAVTFADSRFVKTLWLIASNPGFLSREFSEGRTVKYLKPLSVFFLLNLVYFLVPVIQLFNASLRTQVNSFQGRLAIQAVANKMTKLGIQDVNSFSILYDQKTAGFAKMLVIVFVVLTSLPLNLIHPSRRRYFTDHVGLSIELVCFNLLINALLLNNPCGNGSFGGLLNPSNNLTDENGANNTAATAGAFSPTTGGYTVVMNSGNAQVDACLTDANVKNELAIGILGTERLSGATPSDDADGIADQWHYVKLSGGTQPQQPPVGDNDQLVQHGAYPSVDNTIASTYDLYAEATFNRRPNSSYPGAIGADKIAVMNKLPALMGDPATIIGEGLLGLAALPVNGYDPTVTSPTLKGGRSGNTCRPTTLQY